MLRIAYISSPTAAQKPKKLTAMEKLRMDAIASLAIRKLHDRQKAVKLFAKELAELEQLERQYGIANG